MNEKEQSELRVKVAELCGYTTEEREHHTIWIRPNGETLGYVAHLLDYSNDLNACAEFEKGLSKEQKEVYTCNLYRVVVNSDGRRHFPISAWMAFWLLSATAEQRCRAFVATMEKTS